MNNKNEFYIFHIYIYTWRRLTVLFILILSDLWTSWIKSITENLLQINGKYLLMNAQKCGILKIYSTSKHDFWIFKKIIKKNCLLHTFSFDLEDDSLSKQTSGCASQMGCFSDNLHFPMNKFCKINQNGTCCVWDF